MRIKGAGIILGGGRGSRIGQDKCLMRLDGKPIFEIVFGKLKPLVNEIILVTNAPQHFAEGSEFRIVTDEIPHQGPLGGILAGLSFSSHKYNLVVACDMPFLNTGLIKFLFSEISDADAVVPCSDEGIEPLHAIYSKDCLPAIRSKLESGRKRVVSFFDEVKIKYVDKEKVKEFDPDYRSFFNINTRDDWESAKKMFKRGS